MQIAWHNVSSQCFGGNHTWYMANYFIMMILTLPFGIITFFLVLCCPCCAQMLYQELIPAVVAIYRFGDVPPEIFGAEAESGGATQTLLDQLKKGKNDGTVDDCAICLVNFGDDEEVVPLPCNPRHYFHEACIEEWLKTNSVCPLCRTPVTEEMLH